MSEYLYARMPSQAELSRQAARRHEHREAAREARQSQPKQRPRALLLLRRALAR